jgi:hypothetical protein
MSRANQQKTKKKRKLAVTTLLAYEAIPESLKLLQKYGQPKAANCDDLEEKLNDLYNATPDKVSLERELAEIHPHKDWLLKTLAPTIQPNATTLDVEAQKILVDKDAEDVHSDYMSSGIDGSEMKNTATLPKSKLELTKTDYLGFMGVIGAIALSYYIINMANKAK